MAIKHVSQDSVAPLPTIPAGTNTTAATAKKEGPDYNNSEFPVLSFLFALHCDVEYSERTFRRYLNDQTDKSYLDNYVSGNRRVFPAGAIHLIHDVVPKNPPTSDGHYPPTRGQSSQMIVQYMLPELTYVASTDELSPTPPVNIGFYDSSRPLLSCLALIFMNGDKTFDPASKKDQLTPEVCEALKRTAWAGNGRPFLAAADVLTLLPTLVDEFALGRAVW